MYIYFFIYVYFFFFKFFSHIGYKRVESRVPCAVRWVLVDWTVFQNRSRVRLRVWTLQFFLHRKMFCLMVRSYGRVPGNGDPLLLLGWVSFQIVDEVGLVLWNMENPPPFKWIFQCTLCGILAPQNSGLWVFAIRVWKESLASFLLRLFLLLLRWQMVPRCFENLTKPRLPCSPVGKSPCFQWRRFNPYLGN